MKQRAATAFFTATPAILSSQNPSTSQAFLRPLDDDDDHDEEEDDEGEDDDEDTKA